jgi:hypothetical protein
MSVCIFIVAISLLSSNAVNGFINLPITVIPLWTLCLSSIASIGVMVRGQRVYVPAFLGFIVGCLMLLTLLPYAVDHGILVAIWCICFLGCHGLLVGVGIADLKAHKTFNGMLLILAAFGSFIALFII